MPKPTPADIAYTRGILASALKRLDQAIEEMHTLTKDLVKRTKDGDPTDIVRSVLDLEGHRALLLHHMTNCFDYANDLVAATAPFQDPLL
jgi:hypothetical protein